MIIGLYDTSYIYDFIRIFGNVELPSGTNIVEVETRKDMNNENRRTSFEH